MKVLFLFITFFSFILSVKAQRVFNHYICQVSHKHSETAFYLEVGETKMVEVGGWKIFSTIRRLERNVEVSLRRVVNILDATYEKEAKRTYGSHERTLPVQLEHSFGGKTDIFHMVCYPREP
jgi:hypothetical protein